jgi:predicted DNA-binding mobile mystery protein A
MDADFQRLARRQLSLALTSYSGAGGRAAPSNGWISALREALDMTVRQLAARLGISPSNVVRLEQRERDDTISLGALRRAANALDCDLVYAVVPRTGPTTRPADELLDALIETRARAVAEAELDRVAHTMALEDQSVSSADMQAQIADRAAALVREPRRLWEQAVATAKTRRARSA